MSKVPVITIETKNGPVNINASDFDASIHKPYTSAELKPLLC